MHASYLKFDNTYNWISGDALGVQIPALLPNSTLSDLVARASPRQFPLRLIEHAPEARQYVVDLGFRHDEGRRKADAVAAAREASEFHAP